MYIPPPVFSRQGYSLLHTKPIITINTNTIVMGVSSILTYVVYFMQSVTICFTLALIPNINSYQCLRISEKCQLSFCQDRGMMFKSVCFNMGSMLPSSTCPAGPSHPFLSHAFTVGIAVTPYGQTLPLSHHFLFSSSEDRSG